MALFKIVKKLSYIKEKPFKLEKEIQTITEENLKLIFEPCSSSFIIRSLETGGIVFHTNR